MVRLCTYERRRFLSDARHLGLGRRCSRGRGWDFWDFCAPGTGAGILPALEVDDTFQHLSSSFRGGLAPSERRASAWVESWKPPPGWASVSRPEFAFS